MHAKQIRTALVICDDIVRLIFISRALGSHYPVLSASTGKDGLTVAEKNQPDVIVVDSLIATDINHDAILNRVHKSTEISHIPILSIKEPVTDSLLRSEVHKLIGANPPEYCTDPDPSSCGIIPKRKTEKAIRRVQHSDPQKTIRNIFYATNLIAT